jgi:hypothetical protein
MSTLSALCFIAEYKIHSHSHTPICGHELNKVYPPPPLPKPMLEILEERGWYMSWSILCCYSRICMTGSFIKNRHLFCTVLEAGKSKTEGSHLVRANFCNTPWQKAQGPKSIFTWKQEGKGAKFMLLSGTHSHAVTHSCHNTITSLMTPSHCWAGVKCPAHEFWGTH